MQIFILHFTHRAALNTVKQDCFLFLIKYAVRCSLSNDDIHDMLGKAYCGIIFHNTHTHGHIAHP